MNKTPNTLEVFKETDERTEWDDLENAESPAREDIDVKAVMDSVEVPELDLPDDDTTAETSAESTYAATNQEIYDSLFNRLNKEIFTSENNGNSLETTKSRSDIRDILIDVHLTNELNTQNGEPEIPLTTAIERRKALYDQKYELYQKLGDTERAKENIRLSTRTTELIGYADSAKKSIEDHKNPESNYNQLASQFK